MGSFHDSICEQRHSGTGTWFLQGEERGADVTVVYVDGQLFAAELDRATFEGEDWRCHISDTHPLQLKEAELTAEEGERIRKFMADVRLRYGRLDSIRRDDGELAFLEVNTNGEWGWLDDGRRGIFRAFWERARILYERWCEDAAVVSTAPDGEVPSSRGG